jgi:hypothetical protein
MLFNVPHVIRDTSKCLSCLGGFYDKSDCTNVTKFKTKNMSLFVTMVASLRIRRLLQVNLGL